jgi:hypothetical protein
MIRFLCPNCETPMEVDESFAGRRARCPTCGNSLKIPKAGDAAGPGSRVAPQATGPTAVKINGESVEIRPPLDPMAIVSAALAAVALISPVLCGGILGRLFYPSGWMIGFIFGAILALLASVFGLSGYYNVRRSRGRRAGRLIAAIGMLGGLGLFIVFGAGAVVATVRVALRPSCEDNLKVIYVALREYAGKHDGALPRDLAILVREKYLDSDARLTCPDYHVASGTQTYRLVPAINLNDPVYPPDMMIVADGEPIHSHSDGSVRVLLKEGTVHLVPQSEWGPYMKDQQGKWNEALKQKRKRLEEAEPPPKEDPAKKGAPAKKEDEEPAAEPPKKEKAPAAAPAKKEEGTP